MNIYRQFKKVTSIDVELLFNDYKIFLERDLVAIRNFFLDRTIFNQEAFNNYYDLTIRIEECITKLNLNKDTLEDISNWDILIALEDATVLLKSIEAIPRIYRLSKKSVISKYKIINDSIEGYIVKKLGIPQSNWIDIALDNNLSEKDYSYEEGIDIDEVNITRFNILSVVDIIDEETINGKDINKDFEFKSNDIAVLSYENTLIQTIQILASLHKGDNPNIPLVGVDPIYGNVNTRTVLIRSFLLQLNSVFITDDSIEEVSLLDIQLDKNRLADILELSVTTKAGYVRNYKVNLNS